MKVIIVFALAVIVHNGMAEGWIEFRTEQPFYDDRGILLEGTSYVVQLYVGKTPETLLPIDPPVPFLTGSRRGHFEGSLVEISYIFPRDIVWVQFRAWKVSGGQTFEEAAAAGQWTGISNVPRVFVGGNTSSPPFLPIFLDPLVFPGPPIIVRNPANRSVRYGGRAVLSVVGSGGVTLFYQWYEGESGNVIRPMLNATNAAWTTGTLTNASTFWVQLTTSAGTANSAAATVTVQSANEVWLNARQSQAGPVFELHGPIDTAYRIQYSTNLAEAAWTTFMDLRPLSSPTTFTDSTAANAPVRFYRAVSP